MSASRSRPTTTPPPSGSGACWACRTSTAQVLVRRGLGEPERARTFLAADVRHPLDAFGGLREAAARILAHVERGSRITVHGDYDVDGVSATAVLVRALRTLGADVDWYLPSRIDDGYGLAIATVERLAARGTDLLVTVDCAITATEEVAAAKAAGMDVVVTDHHSPRADGRLPDARDRAPGGRRLPVPGAVRGRRRPHARPRAARRRRHGSRAGGRRPRPRGARDGRRLRAAGRREPPARARGPARARLDAQAGAAGADAGRARGPERDRRRRDRLPARAADQRRRAAAPRRRGAGAAADGRLAAGAGGRGRARRGQRRAPRRRDAHPVRGREAGRRDAARRAGVRARRRRLASRRDRHRRFAHRRAPSPPRGADRARRRRGHRLRPLDPGVRPAGRPARRQRATCCATAGTARRPG